MTQMKKKLSISIAVMILTVMLIGGSFYSVYLHTIKSPLLKPIIPTQMTMTFVVTPGTSLRGLIRQLESLNLLDSTLKIKLFSWLVQKQGLASRLQAGEYRIDASTNMLQLIEKFAKGDVVIYPFTIIEGWTFKDICDAINQNPKIQKTILHLPQEELMAELVLSGVHPEGQFFPDTYYFSGKMTDKSLLKRAHEHLIQHVTAEWGVRSPDCILRSPYEAMILASLIEKETSKAEERSIVSGVYQRRLYQKMRLQADPTVLYGIKDKDSTKYQLTHADLLADTPYNTYTRHGLPPTPIAVASLASLKAALHPDMSSYIYFVAKGDGSHCFSTTLEEHNKAVALYILSKKIN